MYICALNYPLDYWVKVALLINLPHFHSPYRFLVDALVFISIFFHDYILLKHLAKKWYTLCSI